MLRRNKPEPAEPVMIPDALLGLLALVAAGAGLAAVISEIALKAPDLFGAIASDVRGMATPERPKSSPTAVAANTNTWRKAA